LLVCAYQPGMLRAQRVLDASQAASLANVINRLDLKPDLGMHGCPNNTGLTNILAFSYPAGNADVDLWWHASGCQSLDNGFAGAVEIANPSFYDGFIEAMRRVPKP
jgi:hypothetical protein